MTEQDAFTNETAKNQKYNDLLQQIDQFPNLEAWWHDMVFTPTIRQFVPQFLALAFLEGCIIYTHNWLAAFLCAVIVLTTAYRTLTMMSVKMVHAFLICQVREALAKGIEIGKGKSEDNPPTTINE
jgi:hypothetical protein